MGCVIGVVLLAGATPSEGEMRWLQGEGGVKGGFGVNVSIMVVCDASATVGCDGRRDKDKDFPKHHSTMTGITTIQRYRPLNLRLRLRLRRRLTCTLLVLGLGLIPTELGQAVQDIT